MGNIIDLTGHKYGRLTVLELDYVNKKGKTYWSCLCECGNHITIQSGNLRNGNTKSCGCYNKEKVSERSRIDLTGKIFGRLKVLKIEHLNKELYWLCECLNDGNLLIVRASQLKNGKTKSCGCFQKEIVSKRSFINLIDKKFGFLTIIELAYMDKNRGAFWKCQCSRDGNYIITSSSSLKSGNTKSCGCLSESWIASELKKYFKKKYGAEIEYKIFKNIKTNKFLPFDIFLPKENIYIEIHGQHHYKIHRWHYLQAKKNNTSVNQEFYYQKIKDYMKKMFAKINGIYIEIDLRKIIVPEDAIMQINKIIKNKIKTRIFHLLTFWV